jgi:hypothetical protein
VAEWVQHGNLHVPNLPVKRVFWPGGFELLQAWWAIFPHRDVIVEAPGLLFYAMACISVYVVCRQLEISRKAAAWSMVVFGLTPVMALSAVSCKNDVAITAFTLYLTALWCRPQPVEAAWKRWVLSCAIICMGIGIKPTLCFILPGILVLAHLGIRRSDFRVLLCPPLIGWMGGVLLLGCLLGGYWYLRNWVWFDNAFYPVSFGGQAGQPQQGSFSWASGFESIRALAVDKIFDGELRDPDVNGTTGWGWFAFVCGWPAVLYGVFTDRKYRWIVAGYLISFLSLMCWISSDPWNMRFVSWMPALGVWGFFVARRQLVPFVRYILVALAAWTTALNGFASAISSGVKLDFQSHYTDRVWNPAFHWFLAKHVPVGEKLAIFGGGDDWVYLVYGPSFERMVCYLEAPVGKGFTDVMKEKNLKYLCRVPSGHRLPEPEWVKDDLQQGRIIEIGRGLYRLAEDNGRENDER